MFLAIICYFFREHLGNEYISLIILTIGLFFILTHFVSKYLVRKKQRKYNKHLNGNNIQLNQSTIKNNITMKSNKDSMLTVGKSLISLALLNFVFMKDYWFSIYISIASILTGIVFILIYYISKNKKTKKQFRDIERPD